MATEDDQKVEAAFQKVRDLRTAWAERMKALEAIESKDEKHEAMGTAYGEVVDMIVDATYEVFNALASAEGITGFQGSFASTRLFAKTHSIDGPFRVLSVERLLYPQYDLTREMNEFLTSTGTRKWLKEEAQKKLDKGRTSYDDDEGRPHVTPVDRVWDHWKDLAAYEPES